MSDVRPGSRLRSTSMFSGESATLVVTGKIIAVAALVSVDLDNPGANCPFLFLPDDFRRLGVEPRTGDRWELHLAIDVEGRTIRGTRLVGLTMP